MSSCTVAASNSPVFSPSSSSCMCSPKSCSSPRLFRVQKTSLASGLIRGSAGGDFPVVLKLKRPPRLDIPMVLVDSSVKREEAAAEERVAFFGVFDGHGGVKAAEFLLVYCSNIYTACLSTSSCRSHEETNGESVCIFCKIIRGQAPAFKVYEDDVCMCILNRHPLSLGHLLIIPKCHFPSLDLTPPLILEAFFDS